MDDQRINRAGGGRVVPNSGGAKLEVTDSIPIIIAILFARGIGNWALRTFSIEPTFIAHLVADALAGAFVSILACFVWIRLKRWRSSRSHDKA